MEERRRRSRLLLMWIGRVNIVIRLRHHISDLCPAHTILERHLIGRRAHRWRFHLSTAKIAEDGTADHRIFVFALPLSTV